MIFLRQSWKQAHLRRRRWGSSLRRSLPVTDPIYREKLSKMNAAVMGSEQDPYYGAPVIILVLGDPSMPTFVEDGSCVLENMMLAAHALGLGSVMG